MKTNSALSKIAKEKETRKAKAREALTDLIHEHGYGNTLAALSAMFETEKEVCADNGDDEASAIYWRAGQLVEDARAVILEIGLDDFPQDWPDDDGQKIESKI